MYQSWRVVYSELNYLDEDMFQAEYWEFVLDIGYYGDGCLRLQIIKDYDWENPVEKVSFLDIWLIEPFIEIFRKKLEEWYYDWKYDPYKWLDKEL
jgi:hypothetical protein